jgi:ATP phosphoribosyltransferase regulatory subunit
LKILMQAGFAGERYRDLAPKVLAPWSQEPALQQRIEALRGQGMRVISALPGQHGGARELGCVHELTKIDGKWELTPV